MVNELVFGDYENGLWTLNIGVLDVGTGVLARSSDAKHRVCSAPGH
jgi:hypothetical protein